MIDKLEMPLEQFAEAVAKENARLNEHNEKLKEQTKLYFHAFNKATNHIEKLEAALRFYACDCKPDDCCGIEYYDGGAYCGYTARKALEGES